MMAPYAIGHLKMGFIFDELGYKMAEDERFKLYLTNTLEMEEIEQIAIPGLSSLSEESHLAGKVKKEQPVLVVLGNPPYSGISANINEWTERLLKEDIDGTQSYYKVDGQPLGEKKLWLQDDYVKFLRFAQWKIQTSGYGIVGMITNHSYLDNPTFRGMRQSLMKTFDEIYILDLHGNSLKKETTPEGGKDENVFDIRQGVAIALFIKNKKAKEPKVFHLDKYGLREKKYEWLDKNEFNEKNYHEIKPVSPWYFFVPRNTSHIQQYLDWKKITEIFPVNVTGIVTARDKFVIGFEKNEIKNRILQFRNLSLSDEIIKQAYNLKDTRGWKISSARKRLSEDSNWDSYYQKILYRPFDTRTIYYTDKMVDWGRPKVMRHMLEENIALIMPKRVETKIPWQHCLCGEGIIEHVTVSLKTIDYVFPLFLYPDKEKHDLFNQRETEKDPNIPQDVFDKLSSHYGQKPTSEDILYYIYGVFYSNIYRQTYAEFLKIDFPRVPFTTDYDLFRKMGELGKELADLHLLKSPVLDLPVAKFQGSGDNDRIDKVTFKEDERRIYINKDKYFEGIPPEVWNYHIGGYQVLRKYLKDRKGRIMDDAPRYCRIITALSKTIEIQEKIDDIYPELEKEFVDF
jgi:predicted helicase